MNGLPTITAAIITFGEADNLRRLLGALDWVDQIVVVDGGSSDDTVSIAEAHGCLVERRRLDSFAAQRNRAIELSTSDWVLSVDADELPSQRLVAEIRQRIVESRADAFHVPIRSTIFGRPLRRGGTQNDWPVRLFRRGKARWRGDVHEVLRVDGRVGRLDNWLIHRTTPDLATFLAKMHRYALLEAAARVKAGRRPRRRDSWLAPPGEVFRRLFWKQGFLDGPAGWAFCLLSGLSEWVIARKHLQLWNSTDVDGWLGHSAAVPQKAAHWGFASLSRQPPAVATCQPPAGSCQPNTDDGLLLPLMLDNVPAPLIEALRQEGIPVRDCRDPGRPARFVLFDSREGPCRKADWQVAIDVDEIRRRWPNDPLEELGSEDSALHQWRSGGLTVTEEIAAVD
ncbi:MAG: glycosyltransferase family 2 protein, partial [Thermoguttaceae bacterium]